MSTIPMPEEVTRRWQAAFGSASPVGYVCRAELHPRWLRIHSLPLSKRYPENESEREEIVRRHLTVARDLLGEQTTCTLFLTCFGTLDEATAESSSEVEYSAMSHLPELSFSSEGEDMNFYATSLLWDEERMIRLILASADGVSGPMLFANLERGTAYAPYDGGADLIFRSPQDADAARQIWKNWLSARADGL